ncbi:MAG: hypothetical protein AYK22_05955 [Thermoplasmatales archaeon SG8-52-3]|nr:MAG: hypothetical protein AYK22_05955 [Thermoplasmatales archaeon SG8-52-3]
MKENIPVKFFQFNELTLEIHPEVYDPAEDSFLLINAISIKKSDAVLEIGAGCGLIALECARIGSNVVCTDINPYSVELTKRNYMRNKNLIKGNFEVRKGDLFKPIRKNEVFDVIIFNPPYLPTNKNEMVGGLGWFDIATNGGVNGIKITSRFIKQLSKHLNKNGRAYFIFSSQSNHKTLETIIKNNNFNYKVIMKSRFEEETIFVYCLTKK